MNRFLISAVSAALLAGAGQGFAQPSDGNAAAAQAHTRASSNQPVSGGNEAHLAFVPRIFLRDWHRA